MKKALSLLIMLCAFTFTNAQIVRCFFDSLRILDTSAYKRVYNIQKSVKSIFPPAIQYKINPNAKRSGIPMAKYIIPIVVHVIYSPNDTNTNISDAQIQKQINILNNAMKDSANGIQFCLATKKTDNSSFSGILRYATGNSIKAYDGNGGFSNLMKTYQLDPEKYLNIYIVQAIYKTNNTESSIRGIGLPSNYLPSHPGIIMRYDFFGSFNSCGGNCHLDSASDGNIMVHETGHFLGLFHTFEGGCAGNTSTTCSNEGDLCCDTRPESGPHWFCNIDTNTCNEANDKNDNQTNYMSYRACWSAFTKDQKQLMQATIQNSYFDLTEAYNVIATGATGCNYHTALFNADRLTVCDTGTFVFTALDNYGGEQFGWKIINELGNTERYLPNGNRQYIWKALNPGRYTIILTTTIGSDSIRYTRKNYITVLNCKTKIKSSDGNWYFGQYAGVNFSSTSPLIDDMPRTGNFNGPTLNTLSSSISQSSNTGRLLFYAGVKNTSRFQLYNKIHNKLKYGDSIWINYASESGLLCIPRPGTNNGKHFYIIAASGSYNTSFPADKTIGLMYSILDTSLDGGNGAVDLSNRNKPILPPTGYLQCHYRGNTALWSNEALIAIPKCYTSKEYWLIVQPTDSNGFGIDRKFLIYSVQSGGIFFDHVDSSSSSSFSTNYSVASPDGRWIMNGGILFKFDRYNGRLTQDRVIRTRQSGEPCIFSPNSKILYYWDAVKGQLLQVDLTIETRPQNIINISNRPNRTMQIGPDNKIYIGNYGTNYLSVIHYPNNMNTTFKSNACGFENQGFHTKQNGKGGLYNYGLPNVIHAKSESSLKGEIIAVRAACKTMKFTSNLCCDDNFQWDFGDGNTGSGLDVTHTYSSNGKYIITLTSNNLGSPRVLKDTIKIGIDTSVMAIQGDLSICDTTQNAYYSNSRYNTNYKYKWTALHGTLSGVDGLNTMEILWNGNGIKKVTLKVTSFEGCVDSVTKTVLASMQVKNNTISMKNKYCGTDTIFGTTPTGGNGNYKYFWRKRLVGSQKWIEITTPTTSKNLIPENETEAFEYFRFVYSNDNGSGHGCYYQSNTIRITPFSRLNTIGNNSSLCGIISTGSDLDSIYGINYQWQRSSDGISWTDVSGQIGININSGSSLGNFYFYRRKAYLGSCINYSNIVSAGGNKVKVQPKSISTCYSLLGSHAFSFTLENPNDTGCTYIWEFYSSNNWISVSNWEDTILNSSIAYDFTHNPNVSYRCKITTSCSTIYTNSAKIKFTNSVDTILVQPNKNNTLNQGNNINLVCKITRDSLQSYQWQSSHNYGQDWFDMKERKKDTLQLTNVNYCQNRKTYRLKITNKCGNVYLSDTSNIIVNNLTWTQDYWMKDQWLDSGFEKNNRQERVVLSPDLFVANSIRTSKPFPISFRPNYGEKRNYIHAMVRNRGTTTAIGGRLYLYWTLAATGENWPFNWVSSQNNQHFNNDSAFNKNKGYFPMGGQINDSPINLPNINNGDSIIIPYLWKNIPNPDWYYPITPRGKINGKEVNICILGRIETCEESTFGMKFPEVISTHGNAANNNNIATRNLWVIYLFPEPHTGGGTGGMEDFDEEFKLHIGVRPLIEGGLTWVKNLIGSPQYRSICFNVSNSAFLIKADAYISLDDHLLASWIDGGSISSGLERIGNNMFRVLSTNACLENVLVDSGFSDGLITYFAYKNINNRFDSDEKFNLHIDQYDSNSILEGSVGYEMRDNLCIPPTVVESEEELTACNWDESGGVANFTVKYPLLPHNIVDQNTYEELELNESGTYNLVPGEYLVTINDSIYNIIYQTTLNVYSSNPTTVNSIDTVWYNCDYPDSVDYVKSCENGVMYDRFDQVVDESSSGHYILDPQEPWYTFVCADSSNCVKYSTQINFMDIIQIPSSTSNSLTGMYNREENACCFIDLTEAECDIETPLTFGQEIQVYDMNADFLYQTNLELYGGTVLGFRFCPPYWDTSSNVINNWYSMVIRNDECSFCRMDFMCDSVSDPEPFVILNYPSNKLSGSVNQFNWKSNTKGVVTGTKKSLSGKLPTSISVYPNPASSEVNVKVISANSSILTIQITDAAGKPVYSSNYPTVNNSLSTRIDLSGLASGVYTIYVPELNYYYKLVIIK